MHGQTSTATKFSCKYGTTVRLTTDNYETWKANVEVILMGAQTYGLVAGEEERPILPEANATASQGRAPTRRATASTSLPTEKEM